jgi:hypothetical protein
MYTEPSQKRPRMMSGCMPISCIRVTASPGQDRSTINDEITSPDESAADGLQNDEHKKGLMQRCTCNLAAFAML